MAGKPSPRQPNAVTTWDTYSLDCRGGGHGWRGTLEGEVRKGVGWGPTAPVLRCCRIIRISACGLSLRNADTGKRWPRWSWSGGNRRGKIAKPRGASEEGDGWGGTLEGPREGGGGVGPRHKSIAPQLFFYFGPRWHLRWRALCERPPFASQRPPIADRISAPSKSADLCEVLTHANAAATCADRELSNLGADPFAGSSATLPATIIVVPSACCYLPFSVMSS
jgi:hypothetical protein